MWYEVSGQLLPLKFSYLASGFLLDQQHFFVAMLVLLLSLWLVLKLPIVLMIYLLLILMPYQSWTLCAYFTLHWTVHFPADTIILGMDNHLGRYKFTFCRKVFSLCPFSFMILSQFQLPEYSMSDLFNSILFCSQVSKILMLI